MSSDEELRDRMVTMAKSLFSATRAGKISWRLTDVEKKFIYAGTRSSVTVEDANDQYDASTILCLLNDRGTVVDSLETGGLQVDGEFQPFAWNALLEDLYQAARRIAHNVDEALDSMLSDIERGTPSPAPTPAPKKKSASREDPWASSDAGYSDTPPF